MPGVDRHGPFRLLHGDLFVIRRLVLQVPILGLLRAHSTYACRVRKRHSSASPIDLRVRFIRCCVEALHRRGCLNLQLFRDVKVANTAFDDNVSNRARFDGLA